MTAAVHPAFAAFLVFCVAFIVAIVVLVTYMKVTAQAIGEWDHEEEMCECGHGFYDHLHHEAEDPCTQLMCSCRSFRVEREENP